MLSNKSLYFFFLLTFVLIVILTTIILRKYEGNFSSFIYIWKDFYELNKKLFPSGFIIHTEGGYDGQFFYLISRSLFSLDSSLIILDAFELRFRRIGLSILGGILGISFGWENYGVSIFITLWIFHFLSSFLLYKLVQENKQQYIFLLYLFSPFSWSSNFLLVSDSLFASFLIFTIYFFKKIGFSLQIKKDVQKKVSFYFFLLIFLIVLFFLFIRETGIVFVFSFLVLSIYKQDKRVTWILATALFVYSIFVVYVRFFHFHLEGTNPLSFSELIDFPFFAFIKTFHHFISESGKSFFKIIPLLGLFSLAILHFYFAIHEIVNKEWKNFLIYSPLLIYSILVLISEEGYYRNYENLSRFFTPCLPYVIITTREINFSRRLYFEIVIFLFFIFLGKKIFQTSLPYFVS